MDDDDLLGDDIGIGVVEQANEEDFSRQSLACDGNSRFSEPAIVKTVQEEQSTGKFRKLSSETGRVVGEFYRTLSRPRFAHQNPLITAPGHRYAVFIGDPDKIREATIVAREYERIVSCEHGEYAEIKPRNWVVVMSRMVRCATNALMAEYGFTGYKCAGVIIYSTVRDSAVAAGETMRKKTRVALNNHPNQTRLTTFSFTPDRPEVKPAATDDKKRVCGQPRVHKEFSKGMFYVPVNVSFAIDFDAYKERMRLCNVRP